MRQLGRVDGASFECCERAFAEAVPREDDVAFFAKKEGLTAHANSIKIRKIYENIEGNQ